MRFDIISVFPEFFRVLDLSLIGKAQERGILSIGCHDLRDWTDDPHRTVDDTPAGGGAGMVMRPDVWGKAIDAVMEPDGGENVVVGPTVLAIPTPSGYPLTQRTCERIAREAEHVIVACGRYEGIDARVAEHYGANGVQVIEYSLGDYVLNGGEVAAVALVEAVGRLLPGMVGNPESLVEESHGAAGLLEYPVYTRPVSWRDAHIPEVLLSGDHGAAARWRKDRALEKTATRRPDMIPVIDAEGLDKKDRATLSRLGYLTPRGAEHPVKVHARVAEHKDLCGLTDLAARTFPDAAPAYLRRESVQSFIGKNLSLESFRGYLADEHCQVCVLDAGQGGLIGYTLAIVPEADGVAGLDEGAPVDALIDGAERRGPLTELSKFYIDRDWRGTGGAQMLWDYAIAELAQACDQWDNPGVFLGTNVANRRARHAYRKLGFEEVGERRFMVGEQDNHDIVFARGLRMP
ncbi:tRNA (guanosine(37)-N1)-methyltransferase TrmD [Ancrocorticia populi]|uniref:tRNA (guanosine(37)-N1)-methyltransferase TrmD n=1 Tax=Ancrocorticia populi TaxID=2175228 RepID=UPI00235287F4|nr:tRNA (guanosine(37)-N1)-methyltransferase TrmD [Ancrocorticia populi]